MKIISPDVTVFIPNGDGVPRSPEEGPFAVTDDYADHLVKQGVLTKEQVEDAPKAKAAPAPAPAK